MSSKTKDWTLSEESQGAKAWESDAQENYKLAPEVSAVGILGT